MTETGFWTFKTNKIDVTRNVEMAYLTGTYHFTVKHWKADSYYAESDRDKEIVDDGKMLVVWRKTGKGWKIVAYTSSSDLPRQ